MSVEIDGSLEDVETFVDNLKLLKKEHHGAVLKVWLLPIHIIGVMKNLHSMV